MVSRSLIVAEIALSLLALGGGGMLIQGFLQMRSGVPGFDPSPILTARLRVPESKYPTDEETLLLLESVLESARSVEGVAEAALANALPRTFGSPTEVFQIRGRESEEGTRAPRAFALRTSAAYSDTFGIDLVQGRFFDAEIRRSHFVGAKLSIPPFTDVRASRQRGAVPPGDTQLRGRVPAHVGAGGPDLRRWIRGAAGR